MPEKIYAQRIPGSVWKSHKTTIYRLYVTENKPLTSPGGVKDILSTEYGFLATKAQYETRLKKWGFYKYTAAHDRRTQALVLDNQREEGPEIEQHTRSTDNNNNIFDSTYSFSRSIPIRSPSPHRFALQPSPLIPPSPGISFSSASTGGLYDMSLFSMSSVKFPSPISHREVTSLNPQNATWNSNVTIGVNDSSFLASHTCVNVGTTPVTQRDLHELELLGHSGSLAVSPYAMYARGVIGHSESRPSRLNSFLDGYSLHDTVPLGGSSIPDFATSIVPVISRIFPRAILSAHMIPFADKSAFDSAILDMSHPNTSRLIQEQSIHHQFIYMIVHRLVNDSDAVRALDEPKTKLDHLLKLGINYCFSFEEIVLRSFISSVPSPYNLSLIQNIFCAALILGNGPVLKMIMGADQRCFANEPVILGDTRYYPLEYTSLRGHVQATRILLDHGADPNLSLQLDFLNWIGRRPWVQGRDHESKVQIMRLLLNQGLQVSQKAAVNQMRVCGRNELLLLATHCLDKSFETFFRLGALPRVLLLEDWDSSLSDILGTILDRASSDSMRHQGLRDSILSQSLSAAVLRGHASAIKILMATGATPEVSCLISAAQSDNPRLLKSFLDLGADPNASLPHDAISAIWGFDHYYLRDYKRRYNSTAFSEAIRNRSIGALQVLQTQDVIPNSVDQPNGFLSALSAACEVGDSHLVDLLLAMRSVARVEAGVTEALEVAVEEGQHVIIERLLSVGITPSLVCLEVAIQKEQRGMVKGFANGMDLLTLLESPDGGYRSVKHGQTTYGNENMIFGALKWGDKTVIDLLLKIGSPVNVVMNLGEDSLQDWNLGPDLQPPMIGREWSLTPLSAAILKRNPTAMKALMAHGAQCAIRPCVQYGIPSYQSKPTIPAERYMVETRCILTPLAAAAVRNDLPLFRELLRMGADPYDNSAILVCAVLNLEDIVTVLLSAFKRRYPDGAEGFGSDALYHAIKHKSARLIELLAKETGVTGVVDIKCMTDPYERPQFGTAFTSPFGEAIRLHSESGGAGGLLDLLLPLVKNFNALVYRDWKLGCMTSLLYAISLNSLDAVKKLHLAGADISLPAEYSIPMTPLQAAARSGSQDIVNYLLNHGVDPNEPPAARGGATALQQAAITGNTSIAAILLDRGADINAPPALFDGKTAFESATEHGRIEMMVFLVQHGADLLSDGNRQYLRAVDFAKDNLQYAAKELADELFKKVLADHQTSFIGMSQNGAAGNDMDNFGDLFPLSE